MLPWDMEKTKLNSDKRNKSIFRAQGQPGLARPFDFRFRTPQSMEASISIGPHWLSMRCKNFPGYRDEEN